MLSVCFSILVIVLIVIVFYMFCKKYTNLSEFLYMILLIVIMSIGILISVSSCKNSFLGGAAALSPYVVKK